jgi:Uma2 family endonuclease
MTLPPPTSPRTLAELLERLGRVPAERIRVQPPPGTATEADLLCAENRFCELVSGTLVEKPPVGWREAFLAQVLGHYLAQYILAARLGILAGPDLQTRMRPGNIRLPDLSFYSWNRFPGGQPSSERILTLAPDLAVEVLSASNTATEMEQKRREYFDAGCRLVWEVEPELRLVRVYTSADTFSTVSIEGILTGEPVLPGFALKLRDLFDSLERPDQGMTP